MNTVKNNRSPMSGIRAGYGPAPTPAGRPPSPALTKARSAVYDLLASQPEPVGLAALTQLIPLHPNTLREHLQALVRAGIVHREQAASEGRGRPAWLYRIIDDQPGHEYAGLAAALAASIQHNSRDPQRDAITAGAEWGRALVRDSSAEAPATPARERLVALLDRIGFAPSPRAGESISLKHCPLLEAAHRYPEVVCGVHLGIVRGALAECGDDETGSELVPFAEPGACVLHLTSARWTGAGTMRETDSR